MENNSQLVALQWHYRILQAMALEEDIPEKPDDKTIPKYRQIDKVRSIQSYSPFASFPSPFTYLNKQAKLLDSVQELTPPTGV